MVLLYRPIDQLQKLATSAKIPYSLAQQLLLGLTLIRGTHDFEKGLSDWNLKLEPDKTWENFKTHFKDSQTELKNICGPTMRQPDIITPICWLSSYKLQLTTKAPKYL